MPEQLPWLLAVWFCAMALFLSVSQLFWQLSAIALAILTLYISDWVVKVIRNLYPHPTIADTSDKAVFITGCDSGFGRELALRLDKLGFKVYAGCLFPDGEGASTLRLKASVLLQIIRLDVTKDKEVNEAAEFVRSTLDKRVLWSVVNNAGIAAFTEIEWCTVEEFRKIIDVNALGPVRVAKAFLPMLRDAPGRFVMVASLSGRYTFPGFTAYSMSKHAAISFSDGLRREMVKWGITVHTVEPTLYKTPISSTEVVSQNLDKMWNQCPEDIRNAYGSRYLTDFKTTLINHMSRAKPNEKVIEVVNDMVDAVAGTKPKIRYVPSLYTQFRARLLSSLPMELLDNFLLMGQPKTPPAGLLKKPRTLKNPYQNGVGKTGPGGRRLQRWLSMPTWEKAEMTPDPVKSGDQQFFK